MIKPTKRKKEVVDKIYDITKTYPELLINITMLIVWN